MCVRVQACCILMIPVAILRNRFQVFPTKFLSTRWFILTWYWHVLQIGKDDVFACDDPYSNVAATNPAFADEEKEKGFPEKELLGFYEKLVVGFHEKTI